MNFFIEAFYLILYKPLFNALVFIYYYFPGRDFGVAVILLTLIIKIILYPLGATAVKSQKVLQELQPKIQKIQKKYKNDKEKQTKAFLELYQKEKVNPFSGCLPLLVQFPILIALYRLFWHGFQPEQMIYLYNFMPSPGLIDTFFLKVIDLSRPNIILAFAAGICQFVQSKMMLPKTSALGQKNNSQIGEIFQKQSVYLFPVFTVLILWRLPSAIGLYWIVSTLFSIFQQYFVFKKGQPKPVEVNNKR